MPDELLSKLNEHVSTKTGKSKKDIKYNTKDKVQFSKEQKAQLEILAKVIAKYEPVFEQIKRFMNSDQWAQIVKKIAANDDTIEYLSRRTATVSGESMRLVDTVRRVLSYL